MIERYQLRYVLAVAEAGTFSRAAQQLNVTQPTLSTGVAKLEVALGGAVFLRNSRRVEVTPMGAALLEQAREIERGFNTLEGARGLNSLRQTLRLGVLTTLPTRSVEAIVRANGSARTPDVLEIVEGTTGDLSSRLRRRRIDVAVTTLGAMDRDLRAEPLCAEGFRLALWSGHPLATRAVVEPEGVAGEVMLVRRNCDALRDTSRYFTDRGIRPRFSFRTFSEDRAAAMVRAGLGITVVPESWSEPGVTLVRLAEFTAVRHIGLVFGEGWSEGEASRPVLDAVRQVMTAR